MIVPVSRSRQRANNFVPSSLAVVSQICSPQITGEDQPRSWMAVFHLTFFSSLQVTGKPLAPDFPLPSGPRYCGQLSLPNPDQASSALPIIGITNRFIG